MVQRRPEAGSLEDGQGDVLLPGAVLAHADAEAGAEEQLSRGHQVALLRSLELQHRRVPDKGMQLAASRGRGHGRPPRCRAALAPARSHGPVGPPGKLEACSRPSGPAALTLPARRPPLGLARPRPSLVPHSLDGLRRALVVVLLHVPVHGAQLHLPPEVDVHRALLHRRVDEFVGGVPQLRGRRARLTAAPRPSRGRPPPTSRALRPSRPPRRAHPGVVDAGDALLRPVQHQEGRQVGGVGGHDDHGETGPHHAQDARGKAPGGACGHRAVSASPAAAGRDAAQARPHLPRCRS